MSDFSQKLQNLMQQAGISSFKALSRQASVSEYQVLRLRQGKLEQMRLDILLKLSKALQIPLSQLLSTFLESDIEPSPVSSPQEIADLKREYERSQLQLQQQREILRQEFQQSSLQLLETLLLQWPTAAKKAQDDHQLAAVKIVPLVQNSLQKLLQAWGIEAIASVGAEIPYDPQLHQLKGGTAQPGETVIVTHLGYCQGDRLLYRATVKKL
ncbi:nucleotide exchange factor GrpE [Anabaena azotica]|uniref:Nucleotide exchange factor GrpE n=1 Tax=Anabaena azotica FACHB-119 TaxID=947527 RepID=A0ABR8D965_9NOST|nr:nucleotide exchange factor GrpE [Anabaena azotica]MBD2503634.1 nucleotide exchange factor GrpE [Anabaena azotica FACHB-119]